jgi:putative hydrolase of the HAD superfamily
MYDALLLDIGYVIIDISWHAVEELEAATGRRMPRHGPSDPAGEARWQDLLAGRMTADDHWDQVARAAGFEGLRELIRALSETVPELLFDDEALTLMREAGAAGRRVGVLSNDAYSLLGHEFFDDRPEFTGLDAFVDSTEVGARKPDPAAYLAAADALGVAPETIVFLDDTPECVEGARRVGMAGVLVDPFARTSAFDAARGLLGLEARSWA